jgi:hypothetical protein
MKMKVDEIRQSERRKVLENDRKIMSSYLDHARASADDDRGGRFATESKTTVVGAAPITYPQQPSTSPANQMAMMPDEPLIDGTGEGNRLGYAIDRPDAPPPEASVVRKGLRRI